MRDVGLFLLFFVLQVLTVTCAGNEIGAAGCKELGLALSKHSGLQRIDLSRTCVVIVVFE